MATFVRKNPLFSLCGLNCCLCPRFNTDGNSRCPGCGGEGFSEKHPTCAVATCNKKHDNVEFCFQCGEYPCKKYREQGTCDSFISYKRVGENFAEARNDLEKYKKDLVRRHEILETFLERYNEGRSKGLYCLVANDMPLKELELLAAELAKMPEVLDVREKARLARLRIAEIASNLGLEFKLRK